MKRTKRRDDSATKIWSDMHSHVRFHCVAWVAIVTWLLQAPQTAHATVEADLLDAWAQALGGRAKLQAIQSAHRRSTLRASGLEGVLEEWVTARGEYRQELVLGAGIYRELQVFDGTHGWIRDQNAKVRAMAGNDLQDALTTAYMGSWSHLVPGRRPGKVEYLGLDDTKQLDKLRITPEGGHAVVCYLDRKTHMPVREEWREADETRASTFSDWRAVDGVQVAHGMMSATADRQHDVTAKVQELQWNAPAPGGGFAKPEESAPDYHFTSGKSATGIPFELQSSNHIFVQVRVNGGEASWFLFDTGAGSTVLDTDRAEGLGLKLEGHAVGHGAGAGAVQASLVRGVSVGLPGVEVTGQTIASIQLGSLESVFGRRVDGILGYDFISRFVVELDYAAGKMSLYAPADYKYSGQGDVLPLSVEGNLPHVNARVVLPDKTMLDGKFVVDCGAGSLVDLNAPFVEKHAISKAVHAHRSMALGIGGQAKMSVARLAAVRIGRYEIPAPVAGLSQDTGGVGARADFDGLLGGELLRRFTVVFDYPHERLMLEPNSHFKDPTDRNRTGMRIVADGPDLKTFKVLTVTEGSPAASAGVQQGDILTAVDGRSLADITLDALRHMLDQPDHSEYALGLRRAGKELQVKVSGKSWL